MPVNLSIKNVPEAIVQRLRRRAARNHRSLQGELMSILESTVASDEVLTLEEALDEVRKLGLSTPSEAARMVRKDRDAH